MTVFCLLRLVPAWDLFGRCEVGTPLCSVQQTCAYRGQWHIGWDVLLNGFNERWRWYQVSPPSPCPSSTARGSGRCTTSLSALPRGVDHLRRQRTASGVVPVQHLHHRPAGQHAAEELHPRQALVHVGSSFAARTTKYRLRSSIPARRFAAADVRCSHAVVVDAWDAHPAIDVGAAGHQGELSVRWVRQSGIVLMTVALQTGGSA